MSAREDTRDVPISKEMKSQRKSEAGKDKTIEGWEGCAMM